MITTNTIHDTSLEPLEIESLNLDLALKNYTLFALLEESPTVFISDRYLTQSLGYISKQDFTFPIHMLDEESFDRLYNKFLELKTDKAIETIQEEKEETSEEELSLTEFLRTSSDILTSEESAPIIKFVNSLFYQAVKKRASDIHIEVHEHKGEVRFRIDGVLIKHADLDVKVMNLIISRIKVISNLDISEKRIPQDGRTQVKIAGRVLDVRISVLPTYYGEKVVMRILMESESIPHLDELGFNEEIITDLKGLLKYSHGIILVTGPTGSGKSTTLHSFLQRVATPDKNIITVEDPVEYKADNINQVQANPKVGLSFAAGLRSILRQDPDVIMVGEIRDGETAKIAIQAALTGHLVFSTLHTNNSTSALSRLNDMGVERFLISSALLGVLAQRLARKLCNVCKEEDVIAESFASEFELPQDAKIYKSKGCRACNYTGYNGRRAIAELFIVDDAIRRVLKETTDDHVLRDTAVEVGMKTLSDQLKEMLLNGETSMDEAIRVGLKDR